MNKIITVHECPPVPVRYWDWSAYREDWDLGDYAGTGATEAEAIADLLEHEKENDF